MSFFEIQNPLKENHDFHGHVSWKCPSNIALIKYWGKRPIQMPANASISFTLDKAYTITSVHYQPRRTSDKWVQFSFEGKEEISFEKRIVKYLSSITDHIPWIKQLSFKISSENSFPHSSGIASSASSMGALALCLCDIEEDIFKISDNSLFRKKASYLSRLGSGSACRSLYPQLAAWGTSSIIKNSSDLYAVPIEGIHEVYNNFHDDILIVSDQEKAVSSSAGHALMDTNIFAEKRYDQAEIHMKTLLNSMKNGDLHAFGKIVEDEALTLHALMMCSDPSYILMEPNTLEVIKRIRTFRKSTGLPLFFTLDAGPNIHILYPNHIVPQVTSFINKDLISLSLEGRIIRDQVGQGPTKIA